MNKVLEGGQQGVTACQVVVLDFDFVDVQHCWQTPLKQLQQLK